MTSFLKKIKKHVFVVSVFTLLFVVTAPKTSFAADSGPGTWDFLLFANMNAGGKFAGNSIVGTTQQVSPLAQPGYGAGLGIEYWMSDSWALRFMAQGDVWANNL